MKSKQQIFWVVQPGPPISMYERIKAEMKRRQDAGEFTPVVLPNNWEVIDPKIHQIIMF